MANTNDTIDGLLAEFRGYAAGMPPSYHVTMSWHDFRVMLDRFDAAQKRERGDCAKLREALIKARSAICHFARHQCKSLSWENSNIQANCGDVLCSWRVLCDAKTTINAALSAPPRNCDHFATVDEARKAHEEYRGDYIMRASNKFDFPMEFEAWLFAPATEKEGGDK